MKNKELKVLTNTAILLYINKGMAFTAVDICNYLRSENPNKDIRMADVSKIIRKNILEISTNNFSMYQATFIEIDNIRSRYAYLYHYMDFNPDDYLSRDQITIKTLDDK